MFIAVSIAVEFPIQRAGIPVLYYPLLKWGKQQARLEEMFESGLSVSNNEQLIATKGDLISIASVKKKIRVGYYNLLTII
jgi:hypothetical protein